MKRSGRMILSDHDLQLFRYLHAVKVATYSQIRRDIYPAYHLRSVKNRMLRFEQRGLIRGVQRPFSRNGAKVVSLSKQGFKDFVANGFERRVELLSQAVDHDLVFGDIRFEFLRSIAVEGFFTENEIETWGYGHEDKELSKFFSLRCDGVAHLNLNHGKFYVPVEYEATAKKGDRYGGIVEKYYHRDDIAAVIYVTDNESVRRRIMDIEMQVYGNYDPKIFFASTADVLTGDAILIRNRNDNYVSLGEKSV